jgi:hypothetical protein
MAIDGNVSGLNRDAFQATQYAQSRKGTEAKGMVEAQAIRNAVLKDGKIDAAEEDLLRELTSGQNKVTVGAQKTSDFNPANLNFSNTWTADARKLLSDTLPSQSGARELEGLWSKGANGIDDMVAIYRRSPADKSRVVEFLSQKTGEAWDKSSITNGYAPLRAAIASAYSGVNQLQGDANTAGRSMLYEALSHLDTVRDNQGKPVLDEQGKPKNANIPDFLYNWIRPGGYL